MNPSDQSLPTNLSGFEKEALPTVIQNIGPTVRQDEPFKYAQGAEVIHKF